MTNEPSAGFTVESIAILKGGQPDDVAKALGRLPDGIISVANASSGDRRRRRAAVFVCRNDQLPTKGPYAAVPQAPAGPVFSNSI